MQKKNSKEDLTNQLPNSHCLEWTSIGGFGRYLDRYLALHFTKLASGNKGIEDIIIQENYNIQNLWENEGDEDMQRKNKMSPDDIKAQSMMQTSLKMENGAQDMWERKKRIGILCVKLVNTVKCLMKTKSLGK